MRGVHVLTRILRRLRMASPAFSTSPAGPFPSRLARGEEGMSLVEVMVALGVMLASLVALAHTVTVALTDTGFARQRQTANQILNQTIEEVRGLPYETLEKGLSSSDLTGDPNIVSCTGVYYFRSCPPGTPTPEKLIHTTGLTTTDPLVPHVSSFGPPDYTVTYTRKVYVTEAQDVPSAGAYRLTVIVSWSGALRSGGQVEAQTLIYSPEGCTSPTTHPFSAPCAPFFYGSGSVDAGSVQATGAIAGLTYESGTLDLPTVRADLQQEQVSRVEGTVTFPGGRLETATQTLTVAAASTSSAADTDPGTSAPAYHAPTALGPAAAATGEISGNGNRLSIETLGADAASTISATAATLSSSCNGQTDSRPCGYGSNRQNGAARLLPDVSGLGNAVLARVGSQSAADTAYGRRQVAVTGTDGIVREVVVRTLPDVRIGGLPPNVPTPLGWQGYWIRLTNYSVTVDAQSGTSSTAPTVTIGSGQIEAWNGVGYTTTTVTSTGGNLTVQPLAHSAVTAQGAVRVEMSGTFLVQPSTTSQAFHPSSGTTRTSATALAGAPVVGTISYRVTVDGVVVANLTILVNLGTTSASTTYQPAPTA
jgi:type II secretory pathway pseudopilin PulG